MTEGDGGINHVRTDASPPLPICKEQFTSFKNELMRTNNALFGPDGTDGIMARQLKMETRLDTIYRILAYIITPTTIIAVVAQLWSVVKG